MDLNILKIKKRDGRIVPFSKEKIIEAIYKAAVATGGADKKLANDIAERVVLVLTEEYGEKKVPSVEEVQDVVEKVLIEGGYARTAKAYILYRQKRAELRQVKSFLGVSDDIKLSVNALKVLEKRYLAKDSARKVIETPGQMFRRVAKNIATADSNYDKGADLAKTEEEFYRMMTSLEFMPNSPTLMNAGRQLQQLSACFVLPVGDTMEEIFDAIKNAALVHKSGGGTGFSFSSIRPKGDNVDTTSGIASGPLSFMKVFNVATEVIKQGGTRRGANMGIMRIDHPDILEFIVAKEKTDALNNFNISVGITEKFMEAVERDEDFELINPHTKEVSGHLNAGRVFGLIVTLSWKNGEPGIIFLDRLERDNPTPHIGRIESTNPCGEQPLLPYEACNLGSINLSRMLKKEGSKTEVDYEKIKKTVWEAVHFLDNVIDMSKFPIPKIQDMVRANRKIGLGVMGFADMLIELGISYDSDDAVAAAGKIMRFIRDEAQEASTALAKKRGPFPNFKGSIYDKPGQLPVRNATTTTIAPTGTISIIANCSSGIEPLFAVSFIRNVMDGTQLIEVNPLFERIAREKDFYSDELMKSIAKHGSIQEMEGIPDEVKKVFVTAHDIAPQWHIKIQAAFQEFVDNAVSKTVNFSNSATTEDVEAVYVMAYKMGCKGVTIYRDGSRENQVLNIEAVNKATVGAQHNSGTAAKTSKIQKTEEGLKVDAEYAGGCTTCGA
ncbi:MAG: vitamin B12-dependent ribonucleotide reductase [bacterium]